MRHALKLALMVSFVWLVAAAASAQVSIFNQSERWFTLGADMGFYAGSDSGVDYANMSMILLAGARIHENVDLELQLPGTLHAESSDLVDSEVRFRFANPSVGAFYVTQNKLSMFRIGGFVAVPVASIPNDSLQDATLATNGYGYAAAMRGSWNYWLWTPGTISVGASSQAEWSVIPILSFAVDGAIAGLFDAGDGREQSDFLGQLAGEAAFKLGEVFRLGARLGGVWLPTGDAYKFQSFFEPFARLQFLVAYAFAAFNINLDEPAGFSFDSGKVWAVRAGGGLRF